MSSESLERDEDGNYVKVYGDPLNPLRQQYRDFSVSDPLPPDGEERVRNEVEASERLAEMYIPHPEVIDYSEEDGEVVLEDFGDADTVKHYLEENGEACAAEIGELMGGLIADIHRFGSHGDPELDNFLYRDGDIASIDHEFYTEDPKPEDLRGDIGLIESDARTLDTEIYREFMNSFGEAYLEELRTGEDKPWVKNPVTEAKNQFPEPQSIERPVKLVEGLFRTKKRHEDLDIGLMLARSGNLLRNSLKSRNQ